MGDDCDDGGDDSRIDRDEELLAALEEEFDDVDRETRRRHHDLKSSITVEPEIEIPVEAYRTARALAEDTGGRVDSFLLDYLDLEFHFMQGVIERLSWCLVTEQRATLLLVL